MFIKVVLNNVPQHVVAVVVVVVVVEKDLLLLLFFWYWWIGCGWVQGWTREEHER